MRLFPLAGFFICTAWLLPANAFAAIYLGSGLNASTGTSLSAEAEFTVDAWGNLVVTLTNTGGNARAPSDVLTALFFNFDATLSPSSARLNGSVVIHGKTPADGNVGGEWGYEGGLRGAPGGASKGISAVGFGLFGHANFGGPALFTPPPGLQLGGLDAGIVSASQTDLGSNHKIRKTELLMDHVTFTLLADLPPGLDLDGLISDVSFQFGTDLKEPNLSGEPGGQLGPLALTPEPGSLVVWLLGGVLALSAAYRRARRAI